MMTLEEAIVHYEDEARQYEDDAIVYSNSKNFATNLYQIGLAENEEKRCRKCAEEYRQLAEWLKELKAYREQAPKGDRRVTCATCRHLDIQNVQGQAAPVSICRAEVWKRLHMAPHLIGHDPYLPIMCSHWEPKEEGQNNGTDN